MDVTALATRINRPLDRDPRLLAKWHQRRDYRALWCRREGLELAELEREFPPNATVETARDITCRHRGPAVEEVACKPCRNSGSATATVHACTLHGECTLRAGVLRNGLTGDPVKDCGRCNDREPANRTVCSAIAGLRTDVCNACPQRSAQGTCHITKLGIAGLVTRSMSTCPEGRWGAADVPGLRLFDRGRIGARYHRSGWPWALRQLQPLRSPDGTLLDDFVEQTWFYGDRQDPIDEPWIGIFHHPPDPPAWAHPWERIERLWEKAPFRRSLERMVRAVVLSEHLARWFRDEHGIDAAVVLHPTETNVPQWNGDAWRNSDHRLLQVGWYLRNTRAIHQLRSPWRRVRVFPRGRVRRSFDRECTRRIRRPEYPGVVERSLVRDAEYDRLLASSVVVTELLESSANNVVVECLARATPILVNRHPAVVEYLGEGYPLFVDRWEDAPDLLTEENVEDAHCWLADRPRDFLRGDHFAARIGGAVL